MKQYAVPEQLLNAILNYLGKQPYVEVAAMIGGLGQIKEVPQPVPAPPVSLVPKES